MQTKHETLVADRIHTLETRKTPDEYNFAHFGTGLLIEDAKLTIKGQGICPGEVAPDFELQKAGGGSLRLSDLRGKAVLLHFGSYT